ncbi:MAG: hypothetical protein HOE90_18920 [Bacteriovoracaceae bacterium]|jgi:flagellar basal-body rod modification protein FlgD|nr:hypothetical protein [Bacteriovoracaceae bacterium]
MPKIGRPEIKNKFKKVAINRGAPKAAPNAKRPGSKASMENAIERLGVGEINKDFFVDRKTHNKMGKNEFLKLLAVQLQNQDPMKPVDQNKFAGELAQFSQLEQIQNMRLALEKSTQNAPIQKKFLASSFLGKRVLTTGSTLEYKGQGDKADINFFLEKPATTVIVRVMDQQGVTVGEIRRQNMGHGNNRLTWDGKSLDGHRAGKGSYKFQVLAYDEYNKPVRATSKAKGIVQSVTFEEDGAVLTVNGKKVLLKDVDKIELPEEVKTPPINTLKPSQKSAAKGYAKQSENSMN